MTTPESPAACADGAQAEHVECALDALEARGARGFDPEACDCIRALLTRAEELEGPIGRRLVERADAHVQRLRAGFEAAHARVSAMLVGCALADADRTRLTRLIERGDLALAGRLLRRLRARQRLRPAAKNAALTTWRAGQQDGEPSWRRRCALAYEDAVAELVASFALARAVDVVPEGAGPYNPLRIAGELLDGMRAVSPFFLTVQVNRLEELASLLALPASPEPRASDQALPKRRRAVPKRER